MRKILAAFRLGNHSLETETLRRVTPKIPYENRLCTFCREEAESETHFLQKCKAPFYTDPRKAFVEKVSALVPNFGALSSDDMVFYVMTQECNEIYRILAEYIIDVKFNIYGIH